MQRHKTMPRKLALAALVLTCLAACGGGDGTTGPGTSGGSDMTARINGTSWSSDAAYLASGANPGIRGLFTFAGSNAISNQSGYTISFVLGAIRGPGSYKLGVNFGTNVGGSGSVTQGNAFWSTPLSGDAGTITITTLTATRMVGTFSFTADSASSASHGSVVVTDGVFDLPVHSDGTLPAVPDDAGSTIGGDLNGVPWNAATTAVVFSQGTLGVGGTTNSQVFSMLVSGLAGVGAYQLATATPNRTITVLPNTGSGSTACCWGGQQGDVGTVTITRLTATRVKGTVTATLQAAPGSQASGPLVISNFNFDLGLPQTP